MYCSTCRKYAELADKSSPLYIGCGDGNMKFIYYPLVLLWLSIFGQVVLWFGQAKYPLYLSQGTSELKRKFLALENILLS